VSETQALFPDWKFRISRLYQDWDELKAEPRPLLLRRGLR